jgi:hypothetical protein
MKSRMLSRLAFVAMIIGALQNANAGAAVAISQDYQLATAYGGPSNEKNSGRSLKLIGDTAQTSGFSRRRMCLATERSP